MIYISKSKTANIIKFHRKNVMKWLHINDLNVSGEVGKNIKAGVNGTFSFEYREPIETAIKILKKERNYFEEISTPINLGAYYNIEGNLIYRNRIDGRTRDITQKRIIKRLKDNEFFDNDMLVFQVDISDLPYIAIINCKAENFECFSRENFRNHILFSPNTSDPGILYREIPVKALLRVDSVDDEQKIIMGNPLCIKRRILK